MTLDPAAIRRAIIAVARGEDVAWFWFDYLAETMTRFEIDTPARAAAFLAQLAHESAGFARVVESLNYSAARMTQVWPTRFPTIASAKPYEHNGQKLANKVYADRNGNGDEQSGDGWRYRGRGLPQLTGKEAYRLCADHFGVDFVAHPELLEEPRWAALSAGWVWAEWKKLNEIADEDTDDAFKRITRRINGGLTGHDLRRKLWHAATAAMSSTT